MTGSDYWKTGAKIGLLYGTAGRGYFLFLSWFNSQPNPPGQPVLDSPNDTGMKLFIIGVLAFLPVFCLSYVIAMWKGSTHRRPFLFDE